VKYRAYWVAERYEFLSMPLQRFERASSPSDPSPDPEEPS